MREEEVVSGEQIVKRDMRKEQLRAVYDALDMLEARLNMLALPSKSEAVDLVLRLRQKIVAEFSDVEHGA